MPQKREFKIGDRVKTDPLDTSLLFSFRGVEGEVTETDIDGSGMSRTTVRISGRPHPHDPMGWAFRTEALILLEAIEEIPQYHLTEEGFSTCEENWDRGLNLI